MDFTNREIATYLWIGSWLILTTISKFDVRRSFIDLIVAIAQPKLLFLFGSAAAYIGLCVIIFASIGLWTSENIKTTILWAISFVFISLFEITKVSRAKEEKIFFVKLVREIFAVTGILTFIIELHSFSLITELVLVPTIAFLHLVHAVAQIEPKSTPIRNLLSVVCMLAGTLLLLYSLYMTLWDIPNVLSLETLREFGTPILLSLVFTPFLYAFLLLVTYENTFTQLHWSIPDEKLRRLAKWEALFRFGPRLHLLRKWAANATRSRPANMGELRRSFNETITAAKHEATPPFIKPSEGWSPYLAKTFLDAHGLPTSEYHRSFDDEWWAGSSYLELGNGLFPNNLAYYVTGTERIATSLKLRLNINQPAEREVAEAQFVKMAKVLLEAALGLPAAEPAIRTLCELPLQEIQIGARAVRLNQEEWAGGGQVGYSRSLEICQES